MVVYLIDTSSIRCWSNYYPEAFHSFWDDLATLVQHGRLLSVREVYRELQVQNTSDHVAAWAEQNRRVFTSPTQDEMAAVADILAVPHFQQVISERQRLRGGPVADPWLIARAMVSDGCVVTEEGLKPNAAKIPNICTHFGIRYTNWGGVLRNERWRY